MRQEDFVNRVVAEARTFWEELTTPPDNMKETLAVFGGQLSAMYTPPPVLEENLTPREVEVLALMKRGYTNREIAKSLTVTFGTARNYVQNVCGKLGTSTRTEAVARAMRLGI